MKTTDCISADFSSTWYKKWSKIMNLPISKHAKFWEMATIAEALSARGCLSSDKVGLGMGVGAENLVSAFASRGVKIVATDQDPDTTTAQKWNNGQLTKDKETLFYPDIIGKASFNKLVTYQQYDMNQHNKQYNDKFDFIWHNCVIGHLGSMEKSIKHLLRSAKYLKEGGWLVFTTELNISNFNKTIVRDSDTIIWRLKDIEQLFNQMLKNGMLADRLKLRMGIDNFDARINYNHLISLSDSSSVKLNSPDYSEIKIPFSGYAITQVLLCFQKTTKRPFRIQHKYSLDTQNNTKTVEAHSLFNADLGEYFKNYESIEYADALLLPEQKEMEIEMAAGSEKKINLRYLNRSEMNVFDYSLNTPEGRPPLVLATFGPINRASIFSNDDWSSPNRPTLAFNHSESNTSPNYNAHSVASGDTFEFNLVLNSPLKTGSYMEQFALIFEGNSIVHSSIVTINIKVTKKKPKKVNKRPLAKLDTQLTVTPEGFFEVIGWDKIYPGHHEVIKAFSDWLRILGQADFYLRLTIRADEFIIFLKQYIKDTGIAIDKVESLDKYSKRYYDYKIKINDKTSINKNGGMAYFVFATPRSGNTAIAHSVHKATGWHKLQANYQDIDYNRMSEPTIIVNHITSDEFNRTFSGDFPYKVITILRNPMDVLLSAFRFSQNNTNIDWLHGKVFPGQKLPRGKDPISKNFLNWACSGGSKALLAVSSSWANTADATIRYEDFIEDGPSAIIGLIASLDTGNEYPPQQVKAAVEDVQKNYLVNSYNEHRWSSDKDNWYKFIPKAAVAKIYECHKDIFKQLGYEIDLSRVLSDKEIRNNCKKFW